MEKYLVVEPNKRYIQAKQLLFMAINELDKGASPMELTDAIEEFVLAAVSRCFNQHPVTRPPGNGDGKHG